jgi:hypothetical protein
MSEKVTVIQSMADAVADLESQWRELCEGFELMRNVLQAFAQFAPTMENCMTMVACHAAISALVMQCRESFSFVVRLTQSAAMFYGPSNNSGEIN